MPDPFAVDVDRALDALGAAWEPAGYDQIWHRDGRDGERGELRGELI